MQKRKFGNTDMEVTLLGFGGAEIGYNRVGQETVTELLNDALDAGLNVIDTAECYMNSEELIGNAVSHRRNDFYLFTKCGHEHGSAADWSRESLARTIDRSLERLKTDRVDLVQLHSCSLEDLKRGEVIEVLQEAKRAGKTRYIGYSGDGEAAKFAIECGAFDTLQTSINIADQEAVELTMPLAQERRIGVIAKRPVANAAWRLGRKPDEEYHHVYWERLQELDYGFLRKPLAESFADALRFTASVPGVHTMIVGTTKPGRWRENMEILETPELSPEMFGEIRQRWAEVAGPDWVGQT